MAFPVGPGTVRRIKNQLVAMSSTPAPRVPWAHRCAVCTEDLARTTLQLGATFTQYWRTYSDKPDVVLRQYQLLVDITCPSFHLTELFGI